MSAKVTLQFDVRFEAGMRRALAMFEEMEQLALTAPDGQVVDACEKAVIEKGRDLQAATLAEAVARRVEAAEKKGRPSAVASAAASKKTAAPKRGSF